MKIVDLGFKLLYFSIFILVGFIEVCELLLQDLHLCHVITDFVLEKLFKIGVHFLFVCKLEL